ncbi:hypothetical protein K0M31_010218 [Melipona bicolor]|uniref:Uncharacterized protein n=1 Tax=Melipona bicolor TaxID=60889 RepID=A0AA40KI95_9HYME|nr:hypothetical protein K0M31_010218 [Melipona bicolor]
MRAPGFLGWDREEEFMDWREMSRKGQGSTGAASSSLAAGPQSSSAARSMRPRRRSREEARSRTREQGCAIEHRREETRSIDRLECNSTTNENRRRTADTAMDAGHAVVKSRSTSSVGTWKPTELDAETNGAFETRPGSDDHSSSLSSDENRAGEVNKCAKVVSSMTMEKWKETARCETRSRALAPGDLKTPLRLDEAVLGQRTMQDGNAMENRLQKSQRNVDDVGDDELPAFIGNLLVSVERKIERVSLDDLTFPCPACRNIDTDDPLLGCRCAGDDCTCGNGEDACDCSSSANTRKEQSTRSFEIAGIKHIDSDDEEEVRMGFGE